VVDAEQLMVDDPLDRVEEAEADEEGAGQHPVRPGEVLPVRGAPEDEEPGDDEEVGRRVEEAVPEGVELEALEVGDRVPAAQHVVPLQHLVQHDAVEEAAEAEAEEDACRDREAAPRGIGFHDRPPPFARGVRVRA
jgi:hypothetical protein